MRTLGVVGSLSRDVVDGRPPRPGGGVYYAARALRILGRPAVVTTKTAPEHRAELVPRLAAFGLPVVWRSARTTTAFSFHYEGDIRSMRVDAVGDPWAPDDFGPALARAGWVHAAALLRSDFTAETLAVLGRGRRLLLDGQGLVRRPEVGPLVLDADFDRDLLEHVHVLKLSEEEAELVLPDLSAAAVRDLGVPEVVVTFGSRGSAVFAGGRSARIAVEAVRNVDPTGAGDAFAAAYLAARSTGHSPAAAARRSSALVGGLLARRLR